MKGGYKLHQTEFALAIKLVEIPKGASDDTKLTAAQTTMRTSTPYSTPSSVPSLSNTDVEKKKQKQDSILFFSIDTRFSLLHYFLEQIYFSDYIRHRERKYQD